MSSALVLVRLTPKDQEAIASIINQVGGVATPAEALLWALRQAGPAPGGPPPSRPLTTGPGAGKQLPSPFRKEPIPPRPAPLSPIDIGGRRSLEIKLDDLYSCGVSAHVIVDNGLLLRSGVKRERIDNLLSTATGRHKLRGGVSILRVGGGLKK